MTCCWSLSAPNNSHVEYFIWTIMVQRDDAHSAQRDLATP